MNNTTTLLLGLSLAIIMLGMGLSLVIDDFKRILTNPKAVIGGLILQLLVLPLIAFGLAYAFNLSSFLAVGLIILAACPGGPTSNLITHLAKGDTALSITLTAINSFVTILTIPFIINLGMEVFLPLDKEVLLNIPETIKKIMIVSIFPIILGMILRKYIPSLAAKVEKPVKIASAVILVVLIVGIIVKERTNIMEYFAQAGLVALALNVISMGLGFVGARLMKLDESQATSISIETGIQNGTMAITIAVGILGRTDLSIVAGVYSLIMFFTAGTIVCFFRKKG